MFDLNNNNDVFSRDLLHGVYFSAPRVSTEPFGGNQYIDRPVEVRQEFINEMDCELTVVLRNGLPLTLPGTTGKNYHRLVIRQTIVIRAEHSRSTKEYLNRLSVNSPQTLRALQKALEQNDPHAGVRGPVVLRLDYVIGRDDLRKYGESAYYYDADVLVTTRSDPSAHVHPHSLLGQLHATDAAVVPAPIRDGGALFAVEIVDNLGVFGDRYLNIANEVYPVRAKRDANREDGVWITRTHPTQGELGSAELKVNYYPFQNSEGVVTDFTTLHLFETYKDAQTLGDIASARKEELAELEHALQLGKREAEESKQENERRKQEWERERQEQERETLRLKAELEAREREHKTQIDERDRRYQEIEQERERIRHDLELERMRKKDQYEIRSQVRKDTGEWLKVLPGLVMGVIAIGAAIIGWLRK